jgi:hypothetical protein
MGHIHKKMFGEFQNFLDNVFWTADKPTISLENIYWMKKRKQSWFHRLIKQINAMKSDPLNPLKAPDHSTATQTSSYYNCSKVNCSTIFSKLFKIIQKAITFLTAIFHSLSSIEKSSLSGNTRGEIIN